MLENIPLSIIIPSRNPEYLQRTIDDLLEKAEAPVEIIVVLDGYWPPKMIEDNSSVKVIHHGVQHYNSGMRSSINLGVQASSGKYIMKIDEHCLVDQGYDVKLLADIEDNWVVIPRRYRMDTASYIPSLDREPIDNMHLVFPYLGLAEWKWWRRTHNDILIDDCLGMQGSCYVMSRKHWDWLGGLNDKQFGTFDFEAQEISFKTWLGGGRVVTNKKTWYAHAHRNRGFVRNFGFCNRQTEEIFGQKHVRTWEMGDYWLENEWEGRVHDFEWLIEKFWPIPTWPDNWKETASSFNPFKTT